MGIRRFAAGLALTAVAAAEPSTSFSQSGALVEASQPKTILSLASRFGTAELDRDGLDDPMIRGQIAGKDYRVYFYGCARGRDCTDVMFVARWESDRFTDKSMGDWNRAKRFGKAYLDEDGNPSVEFNVNLFRGVSRDNLEDTFDWWRLILAEFADFFGI